MARDFAKAFYKSKEWQVVRDYCLMRDKYLCIKCGHPAEEVHHIIHLNPQNILKPEITLNADNLQSLCKRCHFEEHRGGHGRGQHNDVGIDYEFDASGNIVPKQSPYKI